MRRSRRRHWSAASRLLAATLGVVGLALVAASLLLGHSRPAFAAVPIASSTPADGATVGPNDVTAITITFESAVPANAGAVLTCEGDPITLGAPVVAADGLTLTLPVTPPLPEGDCEVGVLVTGDPTFGFTVDADATAVATVAPAGGDTTGEVSAGDAGAAAGVGDVSTAPLWVGRMLSTLGVAVLFGALVLIVAAWPEGPEYVLCLRFLRATWVVALVGTLIYVASASALDNGKSFAFNPGKWPDLFDAGWPGRAALFRLVLVLACLWVVVRPERVIDPTTNMVALGLPALAVVTLGLSRTGGDLAIIGVLASVVHVLAMAVWLGGVVLLARVVLAGPGEQDLVDAVHGFGRISTAAIVATAVSGIIQLYRVDGGELFSSTHGRIMLAKTLAVAAMLFVGMTARQVARAKLERAGDLGVRTADRLKRAFGTEALIGLVVVALTGWMLNQPTPKDSVDTGGGGGFAESLEIVATSPSDANVTLLDMTLLLEPATVGPNTLRVEIERPTSGLTGLTLTFTPPAGGATEIVADLSQLTGLTTAQTSSGAEIVFDVAGTWTVQVNGSTASEAIPGVQRDFVVAAADGTIVDPEIPASITTVATTGVPTSAPAGTTEA